MKIRRRLRKLGETTPVRSPRTQVTVSESETDESVDCGFQSSIARSPFDGLKAKRSWFVEDEALEVRGGLLIEDGGAYQELKSEYRRAPPENSTKSFGHKRRRLDDVATPDEENSEKKSENATITPLQVDPDISFADVAGLDSIKHKLSEMVFFPLVYPDLMKEMGITPPRGAMFYGPPGTGKTLMARALASMVSKAGHRVSFFMRRGAEILSPWLGEAEKQLRLLFDEAKKQQPSIIFFDEIDGLAPVRSGRSDHSYTSVVTTLLALMDGLEDRGQVVVIGATNRPEGLDPALRRPGRFDREFHFPLPDAAGRLKILNIHSKKLRHPPSQKLCRELADKSHGFGGADLKALCTEACLNGLRRSAPEIYSSEKLVPVGPNTVVVEREDFLEALGNMTPSIMRSRPNGTLSGLSRVETLLMSCSKLTRLLQVVNRIFPFAKGGRECRDTAGDQIRCAVLCGAKECGVKPLARALLHKMGFPVNSIGLQDLWAESGRDVEETFIKRFDRALQSGPSVLYLPDVETFWWKGGPLLGTFLESRLEEMHSKPVLLFVTSRAEKKDLIDKEILRALGDPPASHIFELHPPNIKRRKSLSTPFNDREDATPSVVTPQNPQSLKKKEPVEKQNSNLVENGGEGGSTAHQDVDAAEKSTPENPSLEEGKNGGSRVSSKKNEKGDSKLQSKKQKNKKMNRKKKG